MILYDRTARRRLAQSVTMAETPWMRVVGWLHRGTIASDEGLWFADCDAVHTLGMRSRLDLVFLDEHNRVVATHAGVRPGRFIVCCPGARAVLELGPSFLQRSGGLLGHELALEPGVDQAGSKAAVTASVLRARPPGAGASSTRRRSQISTASR